MRRTELYIASLVGLALIVLHLVTLARMVSGARPPGERATSATQTGASTFQAMVAQLGALEQSAGEVAFELARMEAAPDGARAGERIPLGATEARSTSPGERLARIVGRTAELQAELGRHGWSIFWFWSRQHLGADGPFGFEPLDPRELARCARLTCLTSLAARAPHGWAHPAAVVALRTELCGNRERLPMRLFALQLLRKLNLPVMHDGRVAYRDGSGNVDVHGDLLVTEESVECLLEVVRAHPELRAKLHGGLGGVRHPALIQEALDSLHDRRTSVREWGLRYLTRLPPGPERAAALARPRDGVLDPKLRKLAEQALSKEGDEGR